MIGFHQGFEHRLCHGPLFVFHQFHGLLQAQVKIDRMRLFPRLTVLSRQRQRERQGSTGGRGRSRLVEVDARGQLIGLFSSERGKLFFDFIQRSRARGDGSVDLFSVVQVAQHLFQGVESKMFHDKLHDQRRLVVGELKMLRTFRGEKGAAELAHRRQFTAENHVPVGEIHVLSPRGIRLAFFVDGDAFAQPARHPVARGVQRHHVTKLVPQHRFPVGWIRGAGRRTVRRHHRTETDP